MSTFEGANESMLELNYREESSPESKGLMTVRRDKRGLLKRSILGQAEDYEEMLKKKENLVLQSQGTL